MKPGDTQVRCKCQIQESERRSHGTDGEESEPETEKERIDETRRVTEFERDQRREKDINREEK